MKTTKITIGIIVAVLCMTISGHGAEPVTANPENIRKAQDVIVARILQEAPTAPAEELLRLSQTLSALQGTEASSNMLQVSRAVEPQLKMLPQVSQAVQQQFIRKHLTEVLKDVAMHEEEMLPYLEVVLRGWGYSLDSVEAVNESIQQVDAVVTEEKQKKAQSRQKLFDTYTWKQLGYDGDYNEPVFGFNRTDGKPIDTTADHVLLDTFSINNYDREASDVLQLSEANPGYTLVARVSAWHATRNGLPPSHPAK